jgi:hypothetical protein
MRARDLDARLDRLAHAGLEAGGRQGIGDRALRRERTEAAGGRLHLGDRRRRAAAGLAGAVERALAVEAKAEPRGGRAQDLVGLEDELGATLGDAAGERMRPDASAYTAARLEHDDLRALARDRVRCGEPRQARPDHRDLHPA